MSHDFHEKGLKIIFNRPTIILNLNTLVGDRNIANILFSVWNNHYFSKQVFSKEILDSIIIYKRISIKIIKII